MSFSSSSPPPPPPPAPQPSKGVGKSSRTTADFSLSCAECRRLKLKCPRQQWPCETCIKRGIPHLCPDGVQEKGKNKMLSTYESLGASISISGPGNGTSTSPATSLTTARESSLLYSRLNTLERKLDILLESSSSGQGYSNGPLHELACVATDHCAMENSRASTGRDSDEAAGQHDGTLKLRADGRVHYVGSNAHSMYLAEEARNSIADSHRVSFRDNLVSRPGSPTPIDLEAATEQSSRRPSERAVSPLVEGSTPSTIESQPAHLVWATPGFRSPHSSTAIWNYLKPILPTENTARRMIDVYYASVTFMFHPIAREDFDKAIWSVFYGNSHAPGPGTPSSSSATVPPNFHPHKLALLYSMLSLGVLLDVKRPQRDATGRALYSCAWNALALSNFTESTSLQSILALMHINLYLTWRRGGKYAESAYPLLGTMMRMAISTGLHRDPALFQLDKEERERRRRVFWDLQSNEVFRALAFCRPPALSDRHVDTRLPAEWTPMTREEKGRRASDTTPSSAQQCQGAFHALKCRQVQIINRMLDECLCAKSTYQKTLHFDKELRNMLSTMPNWMLPIVVDFNAHAAEPVEDLERTYYDVRLRDAMILEMQRHITLLNHHQSVLLLHRGWFSQALHVEDERGSPETRSRVTPDKLSASINAVNESASTIVNLVISIWCKYPALVIRWAFFWNALFSAAVCRGLFAIKWKLSSSSQSREARMELKRAIELLSRAVVGWAPLESPLGILDRLDKRAEVALQDQSNEEASSLHVSDVAKETEGEDLELIGEGRRSRSKRMSESDGTFSSRKRAAKAQTDTQQSVDSMLLLPPLLQNGLTSFNANAPTTDAATVLESTDLDLLPLSSMHSAMLPSFFSADPTIAAQVGPGADENVLIGATGNTASASQLIQMLSSGLSWDDVTSWNELIVDL